MFTATTYVERRRKLRDKIQSGLILFIGNNETPMNYPANPYFFCQDSSFLYFFGLNKPGFTGLIDIDEDKDYLFGVDFTIDDIIWTGPQPVLKDMAQEVGINDTGTPDQLTDIINNAVSQSRKIHFLPPYRADIILQIESLLGISSGKVIESASGELINALVSLRSVKSEEEVREIEKALDISYDMYEKVMALAKPGVAEAKIVGKMEDVLGANESHISFPIILSIHGEILHNHYHGNMLKENGLLVVDSGAKSPEQYASDITRTFPVGGRFTSEQRDIYQIVLDSQKTAIESMKPGVYNKEIHLRTATVIASGLKDIGIMRGDVETAVAQGAHALFFPHGLGHMMGLDVHDMENVGENFVGYDDTIKRSDQFGLAYLRFARELKSGYVLTVEPGIYFIPALIDQWQGENKFSEFIDYSMVEKYRDFGGIRIEDDVLVTEDGQRVLGKSIPKEIDEIEEKMKF
jgi:Xaa-Pro aminopeptidase